MVISPLFLLQVALDYIGKRGATVGVTREKRIKYVLLLRYLVFCRCLCFGLIWKISCTCATQVCQRNPSEGNASSCWGWRILWNKESILFRVSSVEPGCVCLLDVVLMIFKRDILLALTDISFIGFYYVHLAEGQRMIGIIMAIRGWILLVLCLVACFGWFVFDLYFVSHLNIKDIILVWIFNLVLVTFNAVIQKVNEGCERICSEGCSCSNAESMLLFICVLDWLGA